ncbi:SWIM-type domain-containing protein [Aphis craccivora]|uniref:SWIM-type domain-containing protein n=1 Tax=Aphis craccivora TaxID=307492 RepID=A0A6G0W1Z0_APHCR|nr:SWIM-type domain-containing protein [Aphis craccivora]
MVLKEKRLPLMRMFQKVLYSADEVNLNEATSNILSLKDEFPNFVKHIENYFKRKNEWVLMFRRDIITRGNNTNNYAKACIRILIEIILNRTKAYNVVALVEFICYVWEEYLILRILDHAHNRRDNIQRNYNKLCSRTSNFNINQITTISETCYSVPSSKSENSVYTIDIQIGVCNCYVGFKGAFCKHQAFLQKHLNVSLPNAPPITSNERYALGQLALVMVPGLLGLKENESSIQSQKESEYSNIDYENHDSCHIESFPRSKEISNKNDINLLQSLADDIVTSHKANDALEKEFLRVKEFLNDVPLDIRQKLTKKLNVIKNAQQLTKLMVTCCRGLSIATKRKGQIKVQPTSIARRRQGVIRGSRRIPAGRPPTSVPQNKATKKKKHNIGKNINLGQSNAKSHGRGH